MVVGFVQTPITIQEDLVDSVELCVAVSSPSNTPDISFQVLFNTIALGGDQAAGQ